MNIGILGSGNVGGTLGRRWSAAGHHVIFSSRDPQSAEMKKLAAEAGAISASTAEAVQGSEVLLLSTPWPAAQ
jgi:predicted dinucleotide-binding enzyme